MVMFAILNAHRIWQPPPFIMTKNVSYGSSMHAVLLCQVGVRYAALRVQQPDVSNMGFCQFSHRILLSALMS